MWSDSWAVPDTQVFFRAVWSALLMHRREDLWGPDGRFYPHYSLLELICYISFTSAIV